MLSESSVPISRFTYKDSLFLCQISRTIIPTRAEIHSTFESHVFIMGLLPFSYARAGSIGLAGVDSAPREELP